MKRDIRYVSTRSSTPSYSFEQALQLGLAPDGGLLIPVDYPNHTSQIAPYDSYAAFAYQFLRPWFEHSIREDEFRALCETAFSFPVNLIPLTGPGFGNIYVLELFHGPTLSFKDFGARFMAAMLERIAKKQDSPITILVATSGDTGSAVAEAFASKNDIRVVLLYPKGQVSPLQELQLTVARQGVTACRVNGTFDDCQALVKDALQNQTRFNHILSSANSINLGRLLPQAVYYAWAVATLGQAPVFHVPSGNLGNLTGGVLALKSGTSIAGFVAAHNRNSFFPEFLTDSNASARKSISTLSNAMDVGAPSNLERLRSMLTRKEMRSLINGVSISDDDTLTAMRSTYQQTGYMADPHTAVALASITGRDHLDQDLKRVVVSTAHPGKFPELMRETLGTDPEASGNLEILREREIDVEEIAATAAALRDVINS